HTMLVGAEGEGKTQTQIAFLVGDIANGDQVVWASTNLSLHHSRDQQTDLRPITHLFEHTRDPLEIMAVLLWASAEVNRRMPCYHADEPHGDPVVIHVDELGGLYRAFGLVLVNAMRNIAEQGRKVDVFLFLAAHNALKESTGLDAALKPLFLTRLLGTVDQFTWTALVGPGVKLRSKPETPGMWHQPDKQGNVFAVQIRRPTAQDIAHVALRRRMGFASILAAAQPYRERLVIALEEAQRKSHGSAVVAAPSTEALAATPVSNGPWEPTELHLQVRQIVEDALPEIRRLIAGGASLDKAREATRTSQRGIARQLQLSAKGGSAAVNVGDAIKDWETYAGVRLFDVSQLAPQLGQMGRSERPERPEHLTPAA
ncbi:MAG: hypothetical protein HGA45_36745, partial [Chloroflexales bacterium]|nr:hypothetical protein [Chloroflexales bacterium]